MRGLDLESSRTLLDTLQRELRRLSNRAVALAHDAPRSTATILNISLLTSPARQRSSRCCSTERTPFCRAFNDPPSKRKQ